MTGSVHGGASSVSLNGRRALQGPQRPKFCDTRGQAFNFVVRQVQIDSNTPKQKKTDVDAVHDTRSTSPCRRVLYACNYTYPLFRQIWTNVKPCCNKGSGSAAVNAFVPIAFDDADHRFGRSCHPTHSWLGLACTRMNSFCNIVERPNRKYNRCSKAPTFPNRIATQSTRALYYVGRRTLVVVARNCQYQFVR